MNNFNEYEEAAIETALPKIKNNLNYLGLGLTGESGEVAEKLKKGIRDGSIDKKGLLLELGDVLWYITLLARALGFSLRDVAMANILKLKERASKGRIHGSGDNR